MAQHMKGPWKVGHDAMDVLAPHPKGGFVGGYAKVCDIRGWGFLTGRLALPEHEAKAIQDANARLIAAAPDMLAALKGLVENPAFELGSPKVSGRAGGDKRDAAMVAWDGFVEAARNAIMKAEGR